MAEIQIPPLVAEYDAEQRYNRWCHWIAWALPSLFVVMRGLDLLDERLASNASVLRHCSSISLVAVSCMWVVLSFASIPVSVKAMRYKRRAWSDRLICCAALAFGLFAPVYLFLYVACHNAANQTVERMAGPPRAWQFESCWTASHRSPLRYARRHERSRSNDRR